MHYPMMTERQVAARWKLSLKTLWRWRLDKEGPIWNKLFHHVRYHETDIFEFERQSAQHWMSSSRLRIVMLAMAGRLNTLVNF